ncbi:ATP-dependent zinc metalloprotease FtsH [Bythopirellula goksoeyrii]|uniref:ATP-dependent zinc metalloprotease FtsH n=1 Tax=Bythopirellula goksoeyrii TaxID=1400387 RepID=A0A5B9Q9J3_9BACT|nr:ATP-dependent zinc metalloprotease FtsH [Bythopirellula goksoeyrii]QEG34310.1 ATP-dependent zinc metalloprotease FtsH [Bythopirellula goksoeyrii]
MNDQDEDRPKKPAQPRRSMHWFTLSLLAIATVLLLFSAWKTDTTISYSQLIDEIEAGNVKSIKIAKNKVVGIFREGVVPEPTDPKTPADAKQEPITKFQAILPEQVGESWLAELQKKKVEVSAEDPTTYDDVFFLLSLMGMGLLVVFAWNMMRRTREQMMGGGMLGGVIKSPARRYEASDRKVTFNDVAGLTGVKKDLEEIVLYLKDAPRFQRLGAQVPKGVLLMGPPGTGKTLLARAVAGEAGVPFFSINGSEFIQMFVGVGAGRVRDMFKTAQENSPAILFIDEIDAVGRQRGAGLGGGHDEREQTLNQILSEMDGFSPTSTVIVLAATNRPDVLDPALLRPGRFDRHVTVDRPTVKGREELFELHSKKVPLTEDVDFEKLARATSGLTGADIRNLVNEAALWAIRHDKDKVEPEDFEYARDKILMGAAREEILTADEKKLVAYHEAGHALVAWMVPDCEPVHKVTIIPRGRSLGVTQLVPEEDRYNTSQSQMIATLTMALAGRAAEKIQFDEFSAGAESDLNRATDLARRMVTRWGMSERLGPVAYSNGEEQPFLGREMAHEHRTFSERTAQIIDEEVAKILHSADDRANRMLTENASKLEALSMALLEREMLDTEEIAEILGPSARNTRRTANHMPV